MLKSAADFYQPPIWFSVFSFWFLAEKTSTSDPTRTGTTGGREEWFSQPYRTFAAVLQLRPWQAPMPQRV